MTITELRYIVAVARERHFGRAAKACFVSQPTLSLAVRKLEEELDVSLFERGSSAISITPIGERIVAQAQRVLEETVALKQMAQQGKDQLSGLLRVGMIYTIGPYLLPHLIPVLHAQAPRMPLMIEENFTARLSELLKQGKLDVIVLSLPFEEPGIMTQALYDEAFQVVFPADHPWKDNVSIPAQELAAQNLLLLGAGHCFRDQVLNACPALNRVSAVPGSIQRTLEGSSLETIRHMVASGVGVTVFPSTSLALHPSAGTLLGVRPFADPVPTRRVALAWRKSIPRPQAIEVIRQSILNSPLPNVKMLTDAVPLSGISNS